MLIGDTQFYLRKVHTNISHLGLEWLSFHLHIYLKYITDVLFSWNPFINYPYVHGSPSQAPERPGQAILPSDIASLYLLIPRTKLLEVKNIMQAAENRFSGPEITVRLLDCFNNPHLATTLQSPIVKWRT